VVRASGESSAGQRCGARFKRLRTTISGTYFRLPSGQNFGEGDKRNRDTARKWWEQREGRDWPANSTHDEHPRPIKEGGDPLFIEPGFEGPAKPHMDAGDFQRWGRMGGRPPKKNP
jgi:hypothetical protein